MSAFCDCARQWEYEYALDYVKTPSTVNYDEDKVFAALAKTPMYAPKRLPFTTSLGDKFVVNGLTYETVRTGRWDMEWCIMVEI